VIFLYFLQSDWLQERVAIYDILTVVQKSFFLATDRGVKTIYIQTQKNTRKVEKSNPSILKIESIDTNELASLMHGRFSSHFWGTVSPTFESHRTTKCIFQACLYSKTIRKINHFNLYIYCIETNV
jgi:hypothetical protein